MHGFPFHIGDVVVFLVAVGVIAPLLHRAKVSPVLAFLVVGIIVGPYGAGAFTDQLPWLEYVTIHNVDGAHAFSEIGVILLLFVIGLEISVRQLWGMRRLVFGMGSAQILISAAVIGGVAFAFGNGAAAAAVIGLAFALSSTAIVLQLLTERGQLGTESGRGAFSILLMQDLAVVPILLFVSLAAATGDQPLWRAVGEALVTAAVVIALIMLVGRIAAGRFLRFAAGPRSGELFTGAVLLLIVVTALATSAAGLSLALGAFLAGLLLAETEYRHDIEVSLSPFKGLFLALFFMAVGMSVNLPEALARPVWLVASVGGLIVIKTAIILVLARLFRLSWPAALEMGLMLGAGGEFAFIIIGAAASGGLIASETAQFMALTAGVSMLLTPLLAAAGRRIALSAERSGAKRGPTAAEELSGHVIIVGYGRVGRLLGEVLSQERIAHVALDADPKLVARGRDDGAAVSYGDARKSEILERLGVHRAGALVVTMDDPAAADAVIASAHATWPHVPMYARARDVAHAAKLVQLGAERVTPETLEASLDLAQSVLRGVGVSDEAARAIVDTRRRAEIEAMGAVS